MEAERRHPASGPGRESGRRNLLRAIPSVLRWKDGDADFYRRINEPHLAAVRLHVQSLGEKGRRFGSLLSDMPLAMRRRIELAPEVYRLLSSATDRSVPEVCEALERFCAVEKYIEGSSSIAPGKSCCWSALGDVCVGTGEKGIPDTACSRRPARGLTFAPVARQTVIDGYSPFHANIYGGRHFAVEPHRAGEFREAVPRVLSAFKFIESACAPACAMLDACLRVVVLIRAPDNPDKRESASRRELRGLAAFTNLHSSEWRPERIVNSLLHEGIHALLYKTTVSGKLFTPGPESRKIVAVSPWSGRRLGLGAFVHACFVWFGLSNFWKQANPRSEQGRRLAEQARSGFESERFLDHIPREGLAILEPDVIEAIRSMVAEANGRVGSDRVEDGWTASA